MEQLHDAPGRRSTAGSLRMGLAGALVGALVGAAITVVGYGILGKSHPLPGFLMGLLIFGLYHLFRGRTGRASLAVCLTCAAASVTLAEAYCHIARIEQDYAQSVAMMTSAGVTADSPYYLTRAACYRLYLANADYVFAFLRELGVSLLFVGGCAIAVILVMHFAAQRRKAAAASD